MFKRQPRIQSSFLPIKTTINLIVSEIVRSATNYDGNVAKLLFSPLLKVSLSFISNNATCMFRF